MWSTLGCGWTCTTLVVVVSYAFLMEDGVITAHRILASNFAIIGAMNVICCLLFVLWQLQQALLFGTLRIDEHKVIWESLWNYVLLKVVFLGVILDPMSTPTLHKFSVCASVLLLVLTASGFLKISLLVIHKRIQHLTQRDVSRHQHTKLLAYTIGVLGCNLVWGTTLIYSCHDAGYSVLALLLFEVLCPPFSLPLLLSTPRQLSHI